MIKDGEATLCCGWRPLLRAVEIQAVVVYRGRDSTSFLLFKILKSNGFYLVF
jgi:hypothetical protein